MVPLVKSKEFREKFHPSWLQPEVYTKIIGQKWFLRELIEQKVTTHEEMSIKLLYEAKEFEDRAHKLLDPGRYFSDGGGPISPDEIGK
jgi:hypothetical protein